MTDILQEILAHKREEVARRSAQRPCDQLQSMAGYFLPRRNFYGAVTVPRRGGPNFIAEIKQASPSAGVIRPAFDPCAIARQYAAGGAQALSVLTDERFFGGDLAHIEAVKAEVGLPVLRKDFVIDAYQVHESKAYGADAILVIAEAVGPAGMQELVRLARSLGLWVLVEVHMRANLFDALRVIQTVGAEGALLGINNRDLTKQRVDLATTEALAPLVPPGVPIVAESGIRTRHDVDRMHAAGARAVLVGEALMRSTDPGEALRALHA